MRQRTGPEVRGGPAVTYERKVLLFLIVVGIVMWTPLIYVFTN